MLSTPSPPAGSRALAANAFRKAGLMDSDTRMRDATHDGRKGGGKAHRLRTSSRPRAVNAILGKDQPSSSNKDPRVNNPSLSPAFTLSLLQHAPPPLHSYYLSNV